MKNASKATQKQLETKEGLEIINEELIPALDEVGKGFEKGTIFLPQLLMSAEAAGKAAFAVIKDSMAGKTKRNEKEKSSLRQLRVIFMILERIS